jgi:hypothetical protein
VNDIVIPLNLRHARTSMRYLESTGVSRGAFTGAVTTNARGGDKLSLSLQFTPHGGGRTASAAAASERALLRAWLASLRGQQNRAYITDLSYRRRGSFPTSELLTNNTFANGTMGWSTGAGWSHAVADRVSRLTKTIGGSGTPLYANPAVTVVQYVPYAIRFMTMTGRGTQTVALTNVGTEDISSYSATPGLLTAAYIPRTTSINPGIVTNDASGLAGDYLSVPYASLSRSALVDNGPNSLLRSDEFDNASWTKTGVTVTPNDGGTADPLGTNTEDNIVETTANSAHRVSQAVTIAAAATDFSFAVALKANGRTWCVLNMSEATGSTSVSQYFNLSTGATGTTATGVNWANLRAFAVSLGNGWWYFSIVARKTNAATSITVTIDSATADGTNSYTGSTSFGMYNWRATFAASSLPIRLTQTTSAAVAAVAQTGSALYLKGLPASTAGLLEIDDQVELITPRGSELKIVTARLNSDAAGLGYLQFEPPIRNSPVDNAPVIINQPFGRFVSSGDLIAWENDPGFWSTASAEFEEAI